jgi:hypothetical protein
MTKPYPNLHNEELYADATPEDYAAMDSEIGKLQAKLQLTRARLKTLRSDPHLPKYVRADIEKVLKETE